MLKAKFILIKTATFRAIANNHWVYHRYMKVVIRCFNHLSLKRVILRGAAPA